MRKIAFLGALFGLLPIFLGAQNIENGEKIFLKSCWGCHHQSAEAFGPSFSQIAKKRSDGDIKGHILRPDITYKTLGYKRNLMPAFVLSAEELEDITAYIKMFK